MVLLFWVGTVGVATSEFGYVTHSSAALFFISIVLTVFSTDLIKAKLADKLRVLMTPRFIRLLNIILGIAMVIFGVKLIFFADSFTFSPAVHLL
jgi:threonine/homoserine/homoserine lactone efflux protein